MAQESVKAMGLKSALQAFAASPRYAVLKNLQVGRLLPEECEFSGPLCDLTLESLVELGSARIAGSSALTLRQEATLIQLLHSLTTEEEELSSSPEVAPQLHEADTRDTQGTRPTFGSVQLEIMLRQRLEAVCHHERYESIRRRTLGEYWDARWTPAPFEQALRLEQLAKMDLTVLFKKRSVDDNRVYLICCALERAYNSLSIPAIDAAVSTPSERASLDSRLQPLVAPSQWRLGDLRIGSAKKAIIELIALTAEHPQDEDTQRLVNAVMGSFSPEEFISLVCDETVSPDLLTRARDLVELTVAADRRQLIAVLLQGPGVHSGSVARMLSGSPGIQGAVIELLAVLVARGLGAQAVRHRGDVCEGFWTLNVDLVAHLIAEAQRAPKKVSRTQTEDQQSPSLDPILLDWIRVQAGLRSAGKRCPKTKRK
jgi:hypothetical protein